jgi:prepilin-type N-terminal cleavage/methylation domain-containing protein
MIQRLSTNAHRHSGFTLLEVLVGLSILTAGILSIMAIFPLMLRVQTDAEVLAIGASLAQMKAEEIRRDDDRNGSLVGAIRNMSTPSDPITFPREPRLAYSFSGRSLMYSSAANPDDPRAADGVARVIIRYSASFRPSQDVIYELRFN